MAILEIGRSSSRCVSCGNGANPSENGHYTELGWTTPPGTPGCGEEWSVVHLNYFGGVPTSVEREHILHQFPNLLGLVIVAG